jgi:TPR repeat protein
MAGAMRALVLELAWPAVAGSSEDAWAAANRQDYDAVLHLLRPMAEQGEAASQFSLGVRYDIGRVERGWRYFGFHSRDRRCALAI